MKDIVFGLFEEVVRQHYGVDAWKWLREQGRPEEASASLGNRAEPALPDLIDAASRWMGKSYDETLRWAGREAMPLLVYKDRAFFSEHVSTFDFVQTLDRAIHAGARQLYALEHVPEFLSLQATRSQVVMRYESPRRLCAFTEGLIEGAAAYYQETVYMQQPACMDRGDAHCTLVCSFQPVNVRLAA